jgi:hypothetical protein
MPEDRSHTAGVGLQLRSRLYAHGAGLLRKEYREFSVNGQGSYPIRLPELR